METAGGSPVDFRPGNEIFSELPASSTRTTTIRGDVVAVDPALVGDAPSLRDDEPQEDTVHVIKITRIARTSA
jgi:hypothetical protein